MCLFAREPGDPCLTQIRGMTLGGWEQKGMHFLFNVGTVVGIIHGRQAGIRLKGTHFFPYRESTASTCMDIHENHGISIKAWIPISIKYGYPFKDIHISRTSIVECLCMDIPVWISMWISTLVWRIEDWHPKNMDIHMDKRGFLEIHACISYGFSDQGFWGER